MDKEEIEYFFKTLGKDENFKKERNFELVDLVYEHQNSNNTIILRL